MKRVSTHPCAADGVTLASSEVTGLVEHLFRHEAGRVIAHLTRVFGVDHLGLAEDVVQEALARALQTWPYYGVPANPAGWILRAARNLALDVVRREKRFREREAEIRFRMEEPGAAPEIRASGEVGIGDDRLRLMFVCCHPRIPPDAQVALALKILCGFGVTEIGRALLTSEAAIAKRLTRARQAIQRARVPFELAEGKELERRLAGVQRTLYLLFNEGYQATVGDRLVREEVCSEAIRLTELLVAHAAGNRPPTHALLALMLLNAARLPARVDAEGNLVRLEEQDRSRWDQGLIARGMFHFARSAVGSEVSDYHLQAGIAACHSAAPAWALTDWTHILELYDRLAKLTHSPVIALNRAVAVGKVSGPRAGRKAVAAVARLPALQSYHLLHAVLGEFEMQLGFLDQAAAHFRRARELTKLDSERRFLARRLAACGAPWSATAKAEGDAPGEETRFREDAAERGGRSRGTQRSRRCR